MEKPIANEPIVNARSQLNPLDLHHIRIEIYLLLISFIIIDLID